ncbi:MAG: cadherin repeat domain-containing protein, partial [Pseudomonadales bacterium]|nr:cadherin repeat domain-containing protein [Pseudomonadales bacterium]
MSFRATSFAVLPMVLLLAACGGGGGGGPANPEPVNSAPTITDPGALSVQEGSQTVATISATDPEGDSVTFSLQGTDAGAFAITSDGAITFVEVPDYSAPTDADTDNVYQVIVVASDGAASSSVALVITVVNVIEGRVVDGPISGSNVFLDLDGDSIAGADEPSTTSDANGFFSIASGTPAAGIAPRLISIGGTDTVTGKELPNLALISDLPADDSKSVTVTPLTTLIAAADTAEAKAAVLTALGISGSVEDLLTTDSWAAAQAGDATAIATVRLAQQVAVLLQTAESLTGDEAGTAESRAANVAEAVAAQMVALAAAGAIDLTSSTTLATILEAAVLAVDTTSAVTTGVFSAVASAVSDINTIVGDASLDPTSAEAGEVAAVAQTELQTAVESVAEGATDVATFESSTELADLFEGSEVIAAQPDLDGDGLPDIVDLDDDADGVADTLDAFPRDANESVDTDGDGIGNNADTDDDGDGVLDLNDAFPQDASETIDTDSDGIGNNADTDDDG